MFPRPTAEPVAARIKPSLEPHCPLLLSEDVFIASLLIGSEIKKKSRGYVPALLPKNSYRWRLFLERVEMPLDQITASLNLHQSFMGDALGVPVKVGGVDPGFVHGV